MERKTAITSALFQRDFLSVLIVVVNAFSWYFPLYLFFQNTLERFQMEPSFFLAAFGVQCVATVGFAILGTALVKRFPRRDTFLSVWMFIGIIASTLMVTLETLNITYILLVSFLLGISLGLGFPSCLAYFGDYSTLENRGWLAGITFFASGLCILFIGLILSFSTIVAGALILATWRGIGLLLFLLTRSKQGYRKENTLEVSYRSVLLDRSFLLYLVPWIMFFLVNFLEAPIVDIFLGEEFTSFIPIAEFGIGGFIALIFGRFADSVGRKRVVIVGFIMLGIGYAVLGLFQRFILSWYLYIILDGVAWGILLPMFYFVICSELAGNRTKEKYYLIGLIPFLIGSYIQILFTPYAKFVEVSAAFSLASFFLFIAVLPLLYAPETLPQKKMELRRLRKFAEDAKKTKEKYERKRKD
jgi:MFS family permease